MTASTPTATAPTTPTATAPTTRSPPNPTMVRAPPLHHQVVAAGRTQTTATTALVRPFPTTPRTSCPTATLLRALLFTGLLCCGIASVHSNRCTTVACTHRPQPQPHLMHVRTRYPCRISSFWREQPHAALPPHSCPLLLASELARQRAIRRSLSCLCPVSVLSLSCLCPVSVLSL